jgi:purine-nucleoside phosphorylase
MNTTQDPPEPTANDLAASLRTISERFTAHSDTWPPLAAIILGSGLGGLADEIVDPLPIDYSDLPGFARTSASGHRGQLIFGTLDHVPVVAMAGRMHRYEGHSDERVTFPVRLMAAMGATTLIVSNAAGGLNPVLEVGDIVVINDHIDLAKKRRPYFDWQGTQPTTAGDRAVGIQRPGPYDAELSRVALRAARSGDFVAIAGTYIATLGPTYETRAEYRMMRKFGGDVVGMSTAPEVCVAATHGMRVLGLSMVSNVARPDQPESTDHQEVLDAGKAAQFKLREIVSATLHHLIG